MINGHANKEKEIRAQRMDIKLVQGGKKQLRIINRKTRGETTPRGEITPKCKKREEITPRGETTPRKETEINKHRTKEPGGKKGSTETDTEQEEQQAKKIGYKRVHFPPGDEIQATRYYQPQKPRNTRKRKTRKNKTVEITILYANINGVKSKIRSLVSAVEASNCDIVMITETKGRPPQMDGFKWYHKERTNTTGGGVAIAIKNEMAKYTGEVKDIEDQNQEIIWIETMIPGNDRLYIGCYYGPQEREQKEEVERQYSQIETQIHRLQKLGGVIIGGDFNSKMEINRHGINQKESRNGQMLSKMIEKTHMTPINLKSEVGIWTRVNRNNTEEKSVIDYIMVCPRVNPHVKATEVDEKGTLRLRGHNTESDHNTITTVVEINNRKSERKIERWKIHNKEGWEEYNKQIQARWKNGPTEDYETCMNIIKETLRKTIGKTTITISTRQKKKASKELQELTQGKKEKRRQFARASKEEKKDALEEYYKAQQKCREQAEKEGQERTKSTINKILTSNNPRNTIWEMRKGHTKRNKEEYSLVSEDDRTIEDPEEAKAYIADYYEDLYQAREGKPEVQAITDQIREKVKELEENGESSEQQRPITTAEMNKIKKKLKRGKALGPDDIPNEIFLNADENTMEIYKKIINRTIHNKQIPDKWREGEILSIYKGKGKKGKCSCERGITLSSNMGKFYERIINERVKKCITISEHQGGGKKGADTTDHIIILKEAIKRSRKTYITFLDVTKAYDKAWADALLYVINKKGVKDRLWLTVKDLNSNLIAKVRTRHGKTRDIRIRDSIRQGGVLSVTLYAAMMDEIAEEIHRQDMGIPLGETGKIGCLLWMDDVALITDNKTEMQKMLDITGTIADKYHIEFGKEKSKVMETGKKESTNKFQLGNMELEQCEKYKYLGITISRDNTLKDHIAEIKGKTEAAYQVMMSITGSTNFKGIEMEAIWQLLEGCLVPIITYAAEAMKFNKSEMKMMNTILDAIIKRILMCPISTPREMLYWETGLLDIEHIIIKNRLMYARKMEKKDNTKLEKAVNWEKSTSWKSAVEKDLNEMGLEIKAGNTEIKTAVKKRLEEKMNREGAGKSKVNYYEAYAQERKVGKRKGYMSKGSRFITSNIFIARSRMIEVKCNYKNKYQNYMCRYCGDNEETQKHIMEECNNIDREQYPKVNEREIFNDFADNYKTTADKIHNIRKLLTTQVQHPQTTLPVDAPR